MFLRMCARVFGKQIAVIEQVARQRLGHGHVAHRCLPHPRTVHGVAAPDIVMVGTNKNHAVGNFDIRVQ